VFLFEKIHMNAHILYRPYVFLIQITIKVSERKRIVVLMIIMV